MYDCVRNALRRTGTDPKSIDILVINCSLFSPTPSLCSMVINEFGMRTDVSSYNLSGMVRTIFFSIRSRFYINHCPCIPFFSPYIFPSLYLLLYRSSPISALPCLSLSISLSSFSSFSFFSRSLSLLWLNFSPAFLPSVYSNLFRAAQQVWYLWSSSRICWLLNLIQLLWSVSISNNADDDDFDDDNSADTGSLLFFSSLRCISQPPFLSFPPFTSMTQTNPVSVSLYSFFSLWRTSLSCFS